MERTSPATNVNRQEVGKGLFTIYKPSWGNGYKFQENIPQTIRENKSNAEIYTKEESTETNTIKQKQPYSGCSTKLSNLMKIISQRFQTGSPQQSRNYTHLEGYGKTTFLPPIQNNYTQKNPFSYGGKYTFNAYHAEGIGKKYSTSFGRGSNIKYNEDLEDILSPESTLNVPQLPYKQTVPINPIPPFQEKLNEYLKQAKPYLKKEKELRKRNEILTPTDLYLKYFKKIRKKSNAIDGPYGSEEGETQSSDKDELGIFGRRGIGGRSKSVGKYNINAISDKGGIPSPSLHPGVNANKMRTGPIRLKYISNKHNRTITENQTYDIMTICSESKLHQLMSVFPKNPKLRDIEIIHSFTTELKANHQIFGRLSHQSIHLLLKIAKIRLLTSNQYLYTENFMGSSIYFIVYGKLEISTHQKSIKGTLTAGDTMGEEILFMSDYKGRLEGACAIWDTGVFQFGVGEWKGIISAMASCGGLGRNDYNYLNALLRRGFNAKNNWRSMGRRGLGGGSARGCKAPFAG